MSAIYTVYTSPNHAPIPDHLPTLIVTPHGKPQTILYSYLHTNYNKENYLLTPSNTGDLCVAKLFPPPGQGPSRSSRSSEGHGSPAGKTVRCEASRNLKWTITNTGVSLPTYKLMLPTPVIERGASDGASGDQSGEQPLFQVSKPNPHATYWSLFYFTYAGFLIPPKRVEFGKISKNDPQKGGGTRVTITGKTDEEKAVWKTLGEGNEDMVEWIVLCAALTVLDDEIVKAAEAAGVKPGGSAREHQSRSQRSPEQPRYQVHQTGTNGNRLAQLQDPMMASPVAEPGSHQMPFSHQPQPQHRQPSRAQTMPMQSMTIPAPIDPRQSHYHDPQQPHHPQQYQQHGYGPPPPNSAPHPHPHRHQQDPHDPRYAHPQQYDQEPRRPQDSRLGPPPPEERQYARSYDGHGERSMPPQRFSMDEPRNQLHPSQQQHRQRYEDPEEVRQYSRSAATSPTPYMLGVMSTGDGSFFGGNKRTTQLPPAHDPRYHSNGAPRSSQQSSRPPQSRSRQNTGPPPSPSSRSHTAPPPHPNGRSHQQQQQQQHLQQPMPVQMPKQSPQARAVEPPPGMPASPLSSFPMGGASRNVQPAEARAVVPPPGMPLSPLSSFPMGGASRSAQPSPNPPRQNSRH